MEGPAVSAPPPIEPSAGELPIERKSVVLRLLLLVAVIAVGAVAVSVVGIPDVDEVRNRISAAGWRGVAVFVLLYAVLSMTPTPASALTVIGGVLFGFATGTAAVVAGATLGAWGAYGIGRGLGYAAVARLEGPRIVAVMAFLRRRGFVAVLTVRLIPLFPFWVVNYTGGVSGVRQRDYLGATVLGILPATMSLVAVGAYGAEPLSWPFAAAVAVFVLLTVGGSLAARRWRARSSPVRELPAGDPVPGV